MSDLAARIETHERNLNNGFTMTCEIGRDMQEAAARIRELEDEVVALREARGVRVKPLVWKKEIPSANPSYSPNIAWTEFGLIYANEHAFWLEGEEAVKCQGCRETTKAAAQADYERRILAALEPAPVTVGKNDILRMLIANLEQCESDVAPWALKWCDKLASALLEGATLEIVIEDLRALADAGEAG